MRIHSNILIPHPIPYQGSKRTLAFTIIKYFPQDTNRLIEPFAGSAAVTLAAAYHRRARKFSLSDVNQALMELWDNIIHNPGYIADAYETLWQAQQGQERAFYDHVRAQFNQTQRPDYFLYLLARCVKASIRYNPKGEFNQSPDNRRKGAQPSTMRDRIFRASCLLKEKTDLACIDYKEALERVSPSDVVYMDPPYRGVCDSKDHRYIGANAFEVDEFIDTLYILNQRKISFIISYDGQTGEKTFGKALPESLGLMRLQINVGRSSQATLLGRVANTVESLYLSPALVARKGKLADLETSVRPNQYRLFAVEA
jgi:DNA adenine methylase